MTITRHPDLSTLITCSAGSQPEALCTVVASHISICPECFREFRRMEKIGVALFDGLEQQPLEQSEISVPGITSIDTPAPNLRIAKPNNEVPDTIESVVGDDLDAIPWVRLWDGVDHFKVTLSPNARGDLRLLRLQPGYAIPEHGHIGEEMTLVLRGAFRDATGVFRVGDFADLDDEIRHSVVATEDGECILLIGSEREPEFLRKPPQQAA